MKKRVFTFWEPKERIPGYVALCMKTWARFLDGYETVVLDYGNLGDYLTAEEQADVLCRKMTFAMQSDCIRCAVLKKHGGVWMDADTVLTKPLGERFAHADCTLIGRRVDGRIVNYGAYINAVRPETRFLSAWHRALVPRVRRAALFYDSAWRRFVQRRAWSEMQRWDYAVNAIIDPLSAQMSAQDYALVEKDAILAMPEVLLRPAHPELCYSDLYAKYWFEPGDVSEILARCGGIVMLHNSFTPRRFLEMGMEAFAASDVRLARLLRAVLSGGDGGE